MARPAAGNSRLVFALSVAFAGPIADLLNDEGGGVHLVGGSSLGKSTAIVVAGSVYGGGGRIGFAQTWRNTGNGLESVAKAHSGTLLALDEIGELDAREAGSTAYLLVNGQGKGRATTRDADLRPRAEWRVMLLSSGEIGLGDKIAESGRRAKTGQLIRIVDVPADAGPGLRPVRRHEGAAPGGVRQGAEGGGARLLRHGRARLHHGGDGRSLGARRGGAEHDCRDGPLAHRPA